MHSGVYESARARLVLFEERCERKLASEQCAIVRQRFGGPQRYNVYDRYCKCCVVYRANKSTTPIFLTRDPNYPGGWGSRTAAFETRASSQPFKPNDLLLYTAPNLKRYPVTVARNLQTSNADLVGVTFDENGHRPRMVPRSALAPFKKADWCSAHRAEDWAENRTS